MKVNLSVLGEKQTAQKLKSSIKNVFEINENPNELNGIVIVGKSNRKIIKILCTTADKPVLLWWRGKLNPSRKILQRVDKTIFSKDFESAGQEIRRFFLKNYNQNNPLTGLPGNRIIINKFNDILNNKDKSIAYFDIMDFKAYNEVYGFTAGDNVIVSFAELLNTCCFEICGTDYFLGHIGGDDFIVITDTKNIKPLFLLLDKEFKKIRKSFYNSADLSRGKIVGWSRKGQRMFFPLMGICGLGFSPAVCRLKNANQISSFATHLKKSSKAKRKKDNVFLFPEDSIILPYRIENYILDQDIPLHHRRTLIEAMGESKLSQYGKLLSGIIEKPVHVMLKKSILFALGRLRYVPSISILKKYLNHPNPHLRTRAVEALGNIGGAKNLEEIAEKLNDKNPYVAVMAAKSIGNIGHPKAIKYLKNLPSYSSKWLKTEAAVSRCRLGDSSAEGVLEKMIKDPNPLIRKKAALCMTIIPSEKFIVLLYKSALKEKIGKLKNEYIISAARIGEKITPVKINRVSDYIIKLYNLAPDNIKKYLLTCIGRCENTNIADILDKHLLAKSEQERYNAIQGMVSSGQSIYTDKIRKYHTDFSTQVRIRALKAIGELNDIDGIEILRKSLKDPDESIRRAASESILRIFNDETISC
ncbi:MAG: HEAT repeat domain-containing protein [Elusimicrobiota bacterium]